MRSRALSALLFPLVLGLAGLALLPGCSSGEEKAEKTSDTRPAPQQQGSGEDEQGSSGSQDEGGSEEGGGSSSEGDEPTDEDSDTSIPDLDDLTESIPGLEEMGDCLEIASAYGSLYFEALGGAGGAEAAKKKAEDLKSVLPEDLHDDIDVVAEAIGQVAEEGLFGGSEALDSPEYQAADEAINEYLYEQCGGIAGDGA